jgi:hypothetical protein
MMKFQTGIRYLLLLMLILLIGAAELAAQGGRGVGKSPSMSPPVPGMGQQRRLQRPGRDRAQQRQMPRRRAGDLQRMRERVNTMRMWKLTEYLDLSEEQADKFFPRTREHQKEADEFVVQRRDLYDDFRKKIDEGKVNDRDVDQFLDEMARLEKAQIDLRMNHIRGFKDVLSDEQLAKFAIFQERLRRELRQRLGEEYTSPYAPDPEDQ